MASALIWTLIGFMLMIKGSVYLISGSQYSLLFFILFLGLIKFFAVFRNVAHNNVSRITGLEGKVFICSLFPLRTWILIAAMIVLGVFLRLFCQLQAVYSVVISGVGLAMLIGSAVFWKAWREELVRKDD
ncbi:MAG: hypothetical protein ACLFV2_08865 [Desulfurivibrionaceae bacterium]